MDHVESPQEHAESPMDHVEVAAPVVEAIFNFLFTVTVVIEIGFWLIAGYQ